jgi:hypothetical protein
MNKIAQFGRGGLRGSEALRSGRQLQGLERAYNLPGMRHMYGLSDRLATLPRGVGSAVEIPMEIASFYAIGELSDQLMYSKLERDAMKDPDFWRNMGHIAATTIALRTWRGKPGQNQKLLPGKPVYKQLTGKPETKQLKGKPETKGYLPFAYKKPKGKMRTKPNEGPFNFPSGKPRGTKEAAAERNVRNKKHKIKATPASASSMPKSSAKLHSKPAVTRPVKPGERRTYSRKPKRPAQKKRPTLNRNPKNIIKLESMVGAQKSATAKEIQSAVQSLGKLSDKIANGILKPAQVEAQVRKIFSIPKSTRLTPAVWRKQVEVPIARGLHPDRGGNMDLFKAYNRFATEAKNILKIGG